MGFPLSKYILIISTLFAVLTTNYFNLTHDPNLILWLCNFTVLLGLFLCFRYYQMVFDVFFYFCWTGGLLTLLIIDNPVAPPMDTHPVAFIGFILKHSIPLILTVHFIKNDHQKLSKKAMRNGLFVMCIYALIVVIYNPIFDQNILNFRYPTLDIEKVFSPWPLYVFVNIAVTLIWYKIIDIVTNKLGLIHN